MATIQSVMMMSQEQAKLELLNSDSLVNSLKVIKKHYDIYVPVGLQNKLARVHSLTIKKNKLFVKTLEHELVIRLLELKHQINMFSFNHK